MPDTKGEKKEMLRRERWRATGASAATVPWHFIRPHLGSLGTAKGGRGGWVSLLSRARCHVGGRTADGKGGLRSLCRQGNWWRFTSWEKATLPRSVGKADRARGKGPKTPRIRDTSPKVQLAVPSTASAVLDREERAMQAKSPVSRKGRENSSQLKKNI